MQKFFDWVKTHKILTVVLLVLAYLAYTILKPFSYSLIGSSASQIVDMSKGVSESYGESGALYQTGNVATIAPLMGNAAPTPDVTERKVVVNSNFSLLVKDVSDTMEKIKTKTVSLLGYMVTSNFSKGEYSDYGTLQIRVPSDRVDEMSKYLRTLAVKVVSENIDGKDITDQYVDIDRHLADLERQKARMQEIMDAAKTVSEMMNVQPYLNQIQTQIDSYRGQQIYMDGISKTSRLTISLATDEMVLPYAPKQPWKPEAVFKNAVRSMLTTAQKIGSVIIWGVVYTPLVLAVIYAFKLIRKIFKKKVQ